MQQASINPSEPERAEATRFVADIPVQMQAKYRQALEEILRSRCADHAIAPSPASPKNHMRKASTKSG
jgi:hypothetical protein